MQGKGQRVPQGAWLGLPWEVDALFDRASRAFRRSLKLKRYFVTKQTACSFTFHLNTFHRHPNTGYVSHKKKRLKEILSMHCQDSERNYFAWWEKSHLVYALLGYTNLTEHVMFVQGSGWWPFASSLIYCLACQRPKSGFWPFCLSSCKL